MSSDEEYLDAADKALECAKVLAGKGCISDNEFLKNMSTADKLLDHDGEECGQCHHMKIMAEVAREMLEQGEFEDVPQKWSNEVTRQWQESKFFKLWQEEKEAGRDPNKAFEEKGWEP